MKTPFDTVIRTRRREIDHMRLTIHAESTRIIEIDDASHKLHEKLLTEYEAASGAWSMSTEAYFNRSLAQSAHLHAQRIAASEEIDRLRSRASEAYGSMVVLDNAADSFRSDIRRRQQRAEQRSVDDLTAARLARHVRTEPIQLTGAK